MKKTTRNRLAAGAALISMMIPGLVYLLINNYIPLVGLIIPFKKYNYSKGIFRSSWTGLRNFSYLFKMRDAWTIMRNTVGYNLVFIIVGTLLAVIIAVVLNELYSKKMADVYQRVILIPNLISITIVAYLVFAFLSSEFGFLTRLVTSFGGKVINWYASPKYWPYILIFVFLWKSVGYSSIIFYSSILSIDENLYEAAAIDGCGVWKRIRYIILPGLKQTIITVFILSLGKMFFSDFGLFYQVPMHSGLLSSVTDTIDVYVYKGLMQLNDIGRSSAAGFIQSILGFFLVLSANLIIRRVDADSALF